MTILFYISAAVAILATVRVITHTNAIHALLYLVVSLLAVSVLFFVAGAPFIAALEVIVYAGAIMVLFVFAVMMLNRGEEKERQERARMSWKAWVGPAVLGLVLAAEVGYLAWAPEGMTGAQMVSPKEVGVALYDTYVVGVELASLLLLAGLIGAYHVGRREASAAEQGGAR